LAPVEPIQDIQGWPQWSHYIGPHAQRKTSDQPFCDLRPVIFNRGSAEPKGSASICQGFRGWSVENIRNKLACEITSNQAIKV